MRAPSGADLRGLLAGSEYSNRLARAHGVGSILLSSAAHVCRDIL